MYNEKPNEEVRAKRPSLPARIEPDRRWFGNTRTIVQEELEEFRQEVKEAVHDPYSVMLNQSKLPVALIHEKQSNAKKIEDAHLYVAGIIQHVSAEVLSKLYEVTDWEDPEDFLGKIAVKSGRLLKGAEPDLNTVAKMVIHDWQRGKIPYYVPPPTQVEPTPLD